MRVTSRGLGLLLCSLALLGSGFLLGYPELAVIGTTGAIAVAFALVYVAWRPRLQVLRAVEPDRLMRGEPCEVTLTVSNGSRLRAATLIAYDRVGGISIPVPLLRLRAGKDTTVAYPVPTDRRGVITIGPLRVVRRDPLGLVTMPRSNGGTATVWVYPKAHLLASMPPGVARSLDGLIDHVPQGTITFDTLREYVIGDELRHVHWKTTARIGQLMVREHLDTSLPRLVVLLDDRLDGYPDAVAAEQSAVTVEGPHHTSEAFESACEAAASVILAAVRGDLPLVVRLVSGASAQMPGRTSTAIAYLDLLAEANPRRDGSLADAISVLRHQRPGDTLIFLTGPGRPDDLAQIGSLRGLYSTILIGALGAKEPAGSTMDGILHLSASDGEDFAAEWDGVPAW